ncbi:MAG: 4-vinyl reductase [Pseudobdellovibrionaceae bacterium]
MKLNSMTSDPLRPSLRLRDSIERLQAISQLNESDWLDLLQMTWTEYYSFRSGFEKLPYQAAERIADHFEIKPLELFIHRVDFIRIAKLRTRLPLQIPHRYQVAAYGRMRSTITSIESLEKNFGWRLKNDVIKAFELHEPALMDPFAPISIQLITDICEYLHRRQFSEKDFFNMGAYSYEGNRDSLIASYYSELSGFQEGFYAFANVLVPLFEKNCTYEFKMNDAVTGQMIVRSNPDIAAELKIKTLGSPHVCHLKAGIFASICSYFNMTMPKVTHPECEHRGDSACRFVFDFSDCQPILTGSAVGF